MATKKGNRKKLVTALSILVLLLVVIGTITLIKVVGSGKNDPYTQQSESNQTDESSNDDSSKNDESDSEAEAPQNQTPEESQIDPATVSTVDITPMEITVSYVKGIGGFEYEVLRAANGTRYVEFRSPTFIGTKCTNDAGTFVSIIASPTESESTGLAKTTMVDGTKYGLALADASCTGKPEELQKYQKSFSDAFSLLKKIQ
mgnify:CR=1 FL=1